MTTIVWLCKRMDRTRMQERAFELELSFKRKRPRIRWFNLVLKPLRKKEREMSGILWKCNKFGM